MTGLLKDVLQDRARSETPPVVDVDAVISAGRRRVRMRNAAGLLGTVVLTAGVVGGATALDGSVGRADQSGVATTEAPDFRGLSYATGSTIHVGDTTVDAGEVVRSYVATDDGFVWTVPSGDVMFGDGTTTEKIGRTSTDGYYLKSDDTGSLVAWVEFAKGEAPDFVAYDTSREAEVLRTDEGNVAGMSAFRDSDSAYVYAVDDGSVYWHSTKGAVRYTLDTGTSAVLGDVNAFGIADVASGLLAYTPGTDASSSEDEGVLVGRSLTEGRRMGHQGNAFLSPDGTYVSFEDADEMFVNETDTGADVTPKLPGYDYKVVYGWANDDTAMVYGIPALDKNWDGEKLTLEFLTCSMSRGSCEVQTNATIDATAFALPMGENINND